jgi:hypothetical protein
MKEYFDDDDDSEKEEEEQEEEEEEEEQSLKGRPFHRLSHVHVGGLIQGYQMLAISQTVTKGVQETHIKGKVKQPRV